MMVSYQCLFDPTCNQRWPPAEASGSMRPWRFQSWKSSHWNRVIAPGHLGLSPCDL